MASEVASQEQRIEKLHVQIGQLFEANLGLSKALEQYRTAVTQRDQLIVQLRDQIASRAEAAVEVVPTPNRAQRRATARK